MIAEVLNEEADIAVADLSITTERLSAVEFSMPWMNLGISIIYIKPRQAPPSFFSFPEPFSNEVWISTVIALMVVAIMTFVIGKSFKFAIKIAL